MGDLGDTAHVYGENDLDRISWARRTTLLRVRVEWTRSDDVSVQHPRPTRVLRSGRYFVLLVPARSPERELKAKHE